MDLSILSQPYRDTRFSAEAFLTTALEDERVSRVLVVTAWLRESGVGLLVPGLEGLRARGGRASLFFGVDLGGTSRHGVELARLHFHEVHVVHDPSGRTFHPKMYLAVGDEVGYGLVGSNNLTAGGLWHNYEAAITAVFNPRDEPAVVAGIDDYADRLVADDVICKTVTDAIFQRLLQEGWLTDEHADQRRNEDRPDRTTPQQGGGPPLFTPSDVRKRDKPAPVRRPSTGRRISHRRMRTLATARDTWWKPLGAGDAQHSEVGNPTGNVALTHVPHGFDRALFFRNVFFGAETWRRTTEGGRRTELATIRADVEIGNDQVGEHDLELVFRRYRMRRGRATTVLRWGVLLPVLQARDVTGWYLLVERGSIGMYRIRITQTEQA